MTIAMTMTIGNDDNDDDDDDNGDGDDEDEDKDETMMIMMIPLRSERRSLDIFQTSSEAHFTWIYYIIYQFNAVLGRDADH